MKHVQHIFCNMLELARRRRHRARKVALRPAERVCGTVRYIAQDDVVVIIHKSKIGVILAVNVAQQLYFCKHIVNAVSVNVGLTHKPDAVSMSRIVVIVIGVIEIVARCIV